MRDLNMLETQILDTLRLRKKTAKGLSEKRDDLKVQYRVDGNVTVAVVQGTRLPLLGWSKLSLADKEKGIPFNREIGERIAFKRAVSGGDNGR